MSDMLNQLILVAVWSKAQTAAAQMLASQVVIPPGHECLSLVNVVCCTGIKGLCDGLVPHPGEFY
jgi:hypothetical protein